METITFIATLLIGFSCTFFAKDFYLPWGLNSALTIGCFFYFGYLLKKWRIFEKLETKQSNTGLFVACIVLCGLAIYFNGPESIGWQSYKYQNYFLTITAGMTSALAIILLSKGIDNNKTIECIGRNTMSVLIFHKLIVVITQTKLGVFSKLLMNSDFLLEICLALVTSVVATIISILIGLMLRRIIPWSIGEQKKCT